MEKAFQDWWDKEAYPRIVNSPASFILMRHIDAIKQSAMQCWAASWNASKAANSILHK